MCVKQGSVIGCAAAMGIIFGIHDGQQQCMTTNTCAFSPAKALSHSPCKLFSFTHSRGTIIIHTHTHTPNLVGKHNYRSIKINKQGKSSTFNRVKVSVEKCTDLVSDLFYTYTLYLYIHFVHIDICVAKGNFFSVRN